MIDVPTVSSTPLPFEERETGSADSAIRSEHPAPPLSVSILSCAFNEEQNLPSFLDAALKSGGDGFHLSDVVVVASGCTDSTPAILHAYAQRDKRVRPVFQEERSGKASALLAGFPVTTGDVVIVENPDTIPGDRSYSEIASCLEDPNVDIVCPRPVPVVKEANFAGSLAKILWSLHDEVSRIEPKVGEGYAIRRSVSPFDDTPFEDDDALLSLAISSGRLRAKYCPDAVIYLNPPNRFRDYLRQRIRIGRHAGRAAERSRILPSTWIPSIVVRSSIRLLRERRVSRVMLALFWALEIFVRVGGSLIATVNPRPLAQWKMIESTKDRITLPETRVPDPPRTRAS